MTIEFYPEDFPAKNDIRSIRASRIPAAVTLLLILAGCQPLPPGPIGWIASTPNNPTSVRVVLLRGWRDLYSSGIDQLANRLRQSGISAQVYRAAQWRDLSRALIEARPVGPLVLIGFSYGADDGIRIAERLQTAGRPVDLLITIDPVTPDPVPSNVRQCFNYYQTNGLWDLLPWLRGIPLSSARPKNLINIDLRRDRPDLVEPGLSHATIAADARLHDEIVVRIKKLAPNRNFPQNSPER